MEKNSVTPTNVQVVKNSVVGDLENLDLFTSLKGQESSKVQVCIDSNTLKFQQKTSDGRTKIISEWSWNDFIGIEIIRGNEPYLEGGHNSLRPIGTCFVTEGVICCGTENLNKRQIKEGKLYHGRNDKVIETVRNIIMQYFWDWLKINHGAGISEEDTSYIHPTNLKPWEKKAIVYINPYAGVRKAGKLFKTIEKYLTAFGFCMETVTTFRVNQVFEEMQYMETNTFKSYYCRLIFSGDGLVHELINGYYKRPDHEELKLRFGAFPGGSANCASWMGQWSYNLNELDLINTLWAVTRMHFEPLDICKYETNGDIDTVYGFHN